MSKPKIDEFKFELATSELLNNKKEFFYSDWPVVYLINNNRELYIGETYHIPERIKQHLKNPRRKNLKTIRVVSCKDFTKSATLDVEASLINLCSADEKYEIQNETNGLVNHNFANKKDFDQNSQFFRDLWYQLKEKGIVKGDLESIRNSDLFKYSPYKSLNAEQCTYRDYIISDILKCFKDNKKESIFVKGSSGTGKSILAVYLMKLLKTKVKYLNISDEEEALPFINELKELKAIKPDLKIGYVVAMKSFRKTIANVFGSIKGLNVADVISPYKLKDNYYDILIVDEAHRLKKRKNLSSGLEYAKFDECNQVLNFKFEKKETDGNQLDWVLKQSQIQIFFYDGNQTIKPTDINATDFIRVENMKSTVIHNLTSQMRCLGGADYIRYINNILNNNKQEYINFENNYDLKMFDSIDSFCNATLEKEKEMGLCRIVAGYAWKWENKSIMKELYGNKRAPVEVNHKEVKDVHIEGRDFYWNRIDEGWPNTISGNKIVEEFGCIHTIQGYDLNYCGVVIGPELTYDKLVSINEKKYYDVNGNTGATKDILDQYIRNIYSVLLTRGIKGTYVYVCDPKLREYLFKYIK